LRSIEFKNALENYFKFSESSFILQHISENSFDYEKWFEVFYFLRTEGQKQYRTDKVLNAEQHIALQNNLGRFLESYANNVGLNFISGIVRLMNNDFGNNDGRNRLEQSFNFLIENQWNLGKAKNVKNSVLKETCKIVRTAKVEIRNLLASFIIEKLGHDFDAIKLINEYLEDEITSVFIINRIKKRLINVNKEIYEQIERIG
jgi:ATP-dependent DNA helicase RecQ